MGDKGRGRGGGLLLPGYQALVGDNEQIQNTDRVMAAQLHEHMYTDE